MSHLEFRLGDFKLSKFYWRKSIFNKKTQLRGFYWQTGFLRCLGCLFEVCFSFLNESSSSRCVLKETGEVRRTRNENRNESQSPDFLKRKLGCWLESRKEAGGSKNFRNRPDIFWTFSEEN